MTDQRLRIPDYDPTPIFDLFRGNYGTELLTAAVIEFRVFERLASGPIPEPELIAIIGLENRPGIVLLTALKAMGFLRKSEGCLELTHLARAFLVADSPFGITGYIGLAAQTPGTIAMIERLKSNRPLGADTERGAAFIFREGIDSAMEREKDARVLTLSLAGRARNVAPFLANLIEDEPITVVDVGGGSGIYSVALLQKNPQMRSIIWDRPEVLKVAEELAIFHGVRHRLELIAGDMFVDPVPRADMLLLSNILHDWDIPACRQLLTRCAESLPSGGRLFIHDVFLNDDLDGPLPIALYSAALFTMTEGRAYSAAEYKKWLIEAGLKPEEVRPTFVHCGLLPARKW